MLKVVVRRARPHLDDPLFIENGFSFPSGHALNAALGVSILLVVLWRPLGRRRARAAAVTVGVALVAITGLDRLLLGVHYPSDVVGGYVVAGAVVTCSWVAFGPPAVQREVVRSARHVGEPPHR